MRGKSVCNATNVERQCVQDQESAPIAVPGSMSSHAEGTSPGTISEVEAGKAAEAAHAVTFLTLWTILELHGL